MNKKELLLLFLFLISPLLSLPFILVGMYERRKASFVYFSLFMGLFSFLTYPASDLFRHFENYDYYKNLPFSYFIETLPGDIFTQLLSYGSANLGIPYEFNRLFTMTVFFLLIFFVFNQIIDKATVSYNKREIFIRLLIFLFTVSYFTALIGVRSGFALSFFLVGLYYWLDCKRMKIAFFFFILATSIHYSMAIFTIGILLLSRVRQHKWTLFIYASLLVILSAFLIQQLENYLLLFDLNTQASYLGDGIWGTGGTANKSFRGLVFNWLMRISIVPFFILWYNNISNANPWSRCLTALILLYVLFFNFVTISSRIFLILGGTLGLYVTWLESFKMKKNRYVNIFFIFSVLFFTTQLYAQRDFVRVSEYRRLVLPVPYILTQHYEINSVYRSLDYEDLIRR